MDSNVESDYSFREEVYDATQKAMVPGEINVVIANFNTHTVQTDTGFENYDDAYAFANAGTDPNVQTYIIGGDIENVNG